MRFLHTADWHAGRMLKNTHRTPEIRAALQEIAALAVAEKVDLVLVSGDLFDSKNPSAEAEEAVFSFFLRLAEFKIPSVIIAGNHDSPQRLEALGRLLKLTGATVLGNPKTATEGGLISLRLGDEVAKIAMLPFISERRIVQFETVFEHDIGVWVQRYREGMRRLIQNLSASFSPGTVNLMLLHTTMDDAVLAKSEYKFHCTRDYSLSHDMLPDTANYIALGHIHKAQPVVGFPANAARYAGSLIQLDFGEAGESKFAYILEAKAGKTTKLLNSHNISAGKPLKELQADENSLETLLKSHQGYYGYLKLILKLKEPIAGLKDRLLKEMPQILDIEIKLPERLIRLEEHQEIDPSHIELNEAYQQFYLEERKRDLNPRLAKAFQRLIEQVQP